MNKQTQRFAGTQNEERREGAAEPYRRSMASWELPVLPSVADARVAECMRGAHREDILIFKEFLEHAREMYREYPDLVSATTIPEEIRAWLEKVSGEELRDRSHCTDVLAAGYMAELEVGWAEVMQQMRLAEHQPLSPWVS